MNETENKLYAYNLGGVAACIEKIIGVDNLPSEYLAKWSENPKQKMEVWYQKALQQGAASDHPLMARITAFSIDGIRPITRVQSGQFMIGYYHERGFLASLDKFFLDMEVKSKDELVSYVYNHGNNPEFGIYRKSDVELAPTSRERFIAHGNEWDLKPGALFIELREGSEYIQERTSDKEWGSAKYDGRYGQFYKLMAFASELAEAKSVVA